MIKKVEKFLQRLCDFKGECEKRKWCFGEMIKLIRNTKEKIFLHEIFRDDFFGFCKSHLLREIPTSEPTSFPSNDSVKTREITTSHSGNALCNDGVKTKICSAIGYLYTHSLSSRFKMTMIMFFTTVSSFGGMSEARAEESSSNIVTGTCNDAGTCLWSFDTTSGKMTISAAEGAKEVKMDNYLCYDSTHKGNRPWEDYIKQIKDIVVENNITNIGNQAFQEASNIETLITKDVKTIGFDTFAYAGGKMRLVELPSVEVIGKYNGLFEGPITSVDLPNIKKIANSVFGQNIEYVGLPDWNVEMPENAFANTKIPNCSNENHAACGSCGYTKETGHQYVKSGVGCVKHCGEGFVGKNGRCIEGGCGDGYVQVEDWCNRVRYTPAEAAAILKDNENTVTITFRK